MKISMLTKKKKIKKKKNTLSPKYINFVLNVRLCLKRFPVSPLRIPRGAVRRTTWYVGEKEHKNLSFLLLFVQTLLSALGGNGFCMLSIHLECHVSEHWEQTNLRQCFTVRGEKQAYLAYSVSP